MTKVKHGVALALVATLVRSLDAAPCVADGERVAFLGDSITQFGAWPAGYVNLVRKGLDIAGVRIDCVYAGISGHKSNDMLKRLDRDVLARRPKWMTLSCGVNDVWHGAKGVPLEDYKKNISAILDKCAASNVTVVVMTATMIKEDAKNAENTKLAAYNDWLRAEAKRRGLRLADQNAFMQETLSKIRETDKTPGNKLTKDGVHMDFRGNCMMAECLLKTLGVDERTMPAIREAWRHERGAAVAYLPLTQAEFEFIDADEGTFDEALQRRFIKMIEAEMKNR